MYRMSREWSLSVAAALLLCYGTAHVHGLPVITSLEVPQPILNGFEFDASLTVEWPIDQVPAPGSSVFCRVIRHGEVIMESSTPVETEDGSLISELSCGGIEIESNGEANLMVELSMSPAFDEVASEIANARVIPGGLTVLPPIVTIVLAILTKNVILSLFSGVWTAAFFIHWYDPFRGFLRTIDTYVLNSFADSGHIYIILFSWFLSGVTGLMQRSGGAQGLADVIIRFAKTRRSTMIMCFLCGLAIFFDDYANTLIVGSTFRPITDAILISREKLAFLVDATSAPIASISPISSWIGFELSLIDESYTAIEDDGGDLSGYERSPFIVFVKTIPARFYPIAMLCVQLFLICMQRDMGPMLTAERRAIREGKVTSDGADKAMVEINEGLLPKEGSVKRWWNAVVPVILIIVFVFLGLIFTGLDAVQADPDLETNVENVFGQSDSYSALLWSTLAVSVLTWIMYRVQYQFEGKMQFIIGRAKDAVPLMYFSEAMEVWIEGMKQLFTTTLVLILAWSIGDAMGALGTDDFIASGVSSGIDSAGLPVLVFILSALISLATGTSWGTMAIMFPIATKTAFKSEPGEEDLMLHVIGSILAGSVFGDHVTPISDTTILSSLSTKCDLMHHVKTQAPYAIFVALISIFFGSLLSGYLYPTWAGLLLTIAACLPVAYFLSARVDCTMPDAFERISRWIAGDADSSEDGTSGSTTHKASVQPKDDSVTTNSLWVSPPTGDAGV